MKKPAKLRWRSLDGHRFLAGRGPFVIIRQHEGGGPYLRFEVHREGQGLGNAGGVCSVHELPAALAPYLLSP